METVKYLCEFFFGNFWHFLMLFMLCLAIAPKINNNSPTNIGTKEDIVDED